MISPTFHLHGKINTKNKILSNLIVTNSSLKTPLSLYFKFFKLVSTIFIESIIESLEIYYSILDAYISDPLYSCIEAVQELYSSPYVSKVIVSGYKNMLGEESATFEYFLTTKLVIYD